MDKDLLGSYIEYKIGKKVVVEEYEKQYEPIISNFYITVKYKDSIGIRQYITYTYYVAYSQYLEWERLYFRRLKLDKIKKLI